MSTSYSLVKNSSAIDVVEVCVGSRRSSASRYSVGGKEAARLRGPELNWTRSQRSDRLNGELVDGCASSHGGLVEEEEGVV